MYESSKNLTKVFENSGSKNNRYLDVPDESENQEPSKDESFQIDKSHLTFGNKSLDLDASITKSEGPFIAHTYNNDSAVEGSETEDNVMLAELIKKDPKRVSFNLEKSNQHN